MSSYQHLRLISTANLKKNSWKRSLWCLSDCLGCTGWYEPHHDKTNKVICAQADLSWFCHDVAHMCLLFALKSFVLCKFVFLIFQSTQGVGCAFMRVSGTKCSRKTLTGLLNYGNWTPAQNIWAPSSKFVSSSIPSWQIVTAHAQPFRGARDLAFCLKVPLDSLLVWASSGVSGETARMRRLAWTFAARIGDKYQIRLMRPNLLYSSGLQKFWNPNWSARPMMSSMSYEHAFDNPK